MGDVPPVGQHVIVDLSRAAIEAKALLLDLCRRDVNAFCEYVLEDEETGQRIEQHDFHVEVQAAFDEHLRVVIRAHPESGKALSVTTEIPTPDGWRTMGSLRVGDRVFDRRGQPCAVTFATPVMREHRVFDVTFSDGAVLRADADHRWLVRKRQAPGERVMTTLDMLEQGLEESDGHRRWSVPVARAVQHERRRLPIPAYVLGAWLGDGNSADAGLTFAEADRFIWDRCLSLVGGRPDAPDGRASHVRRGTLGRDWGKVRGRLRAVGVLGQKRIPRVYLEAHEVDRRELLAGLLDTDGSVSRGPSGGSSRVELTLCDGDLAGDALQLARGLGFKATIAESDATLDGRVVGRRWRIAFTAREPVFRLPRKLEAQQLGGSTRSRWKHVVSVVEVASEPVRCISVDSPDHTYLAGRAYTVTHNTQQMAVGRVLWELGRNLRLRVALLNSTQEGARKNLSAVKGYIERSARLKEVFPALRAGAIWQDDKITVERPGFSKDPSIQAIGYHGKIQGSRVDLLIVDDLLDFENTRTESQRATLSKWFRVSVLGRLTRAGRVAFLCNAWHPRDLAAELVKERKWHLVERPIYDAHGVISWPERWSPERVAQSKVDLGELEFARLFLCRPRDDADQIFKEAAIELCRERGASRTLLRTLSPIPDRCLVVTGVDLGGRRRTGGLTSLFTLLFHPKGDRQVLNIESGRWGARELLRRTVSVGTRFGGLLAVENNGIQQHIVDLAREEGQYLVPVVPFHTGSNKSDPRFGVSSMAAEMEAARWILPMHGDADQLRELGAWVVELLDYVPEAHTGDRLMASWIAREVGRILHARLYGPEASGNVGARVVG